MANGHGGARQNSGRKPLPQTVARQKLAEERVTDAERAFNYLVFWMDDDESPNEFRRACALDVLDRVHGKPRGDDKMTFAGAVATDDISKLGDTERRARLAALFDAARTKRDSAPAGQSESELGAGWTD